jgi:hypothetical protein
MTKTALVIGAIVVVLLAGGAATVVLISARDTSHGGLAAARTLTGEQAPEAEDHGDHGLRVVEHAARAFLADYLPLIYGKRGATATTLDKAAPDLVARLEASPGRVPPGQAEQRPRLEAVSVVLEGPTRALATAQIHDSPSGLTYPLIFHLVRYPGGGWLVTRLGAG